MADDTNSRRGIELGFLSNAFPDQPGALQLLGVNGREDISRLFSFDLLLARSGAEPLTEDELSEIVRQPCVIAMGRKRGDIVHGILESIEHLDATRTVRALYIARFVPQVALLDLGKRSAIYQETTVPDMITGILQSQGLAPGEDFEFLIGNDVKSPAHEYIVQYQESDWNFIQRWLEREGYFYWFDHKKNGKLFIADQNEDSTPIDGGTPISYRERNNVATAGIATIWDFRVKQRRVPAKVTLVDYNHRRPTDMLVTTEVVDKGGYGHVFHFGHHFKDKTVGGAWTKIRAEEILADRHVVSGVTDCSRFRVGHSFELENHYVASYDGKYLITHVEHQVGLDPSNLESLSAFEDVRPELRQYRARFRAIPLDTPYRPPMTTPWPRIHGIIAGHIEADSSGDYAQIDDQGRYKVKLPFDVGSVKGLSASRWIRMAQAYAGAGYGVHHPQHKGTEVLIVHIDGDPDRPIITAAVPNASTPGPVASANATQSVLQTASGMRVEMEDLEG